VTAASREPACVGVELASRDPALLAEFYVQALGFRCESSMREKTCLRLGDATVILTRAALSGRMIPPDSRSHDRWFRHLALVVRDLNAAYTQLREHHSTPISHAPQRLPDWNPDSAGIEALYFRDPEGHPLELIHFPPGRGKAVWHEEGDELFQGIDHTAIVVRSAPRSVEFYRDEFGFEPAAASVNRGPEQERLANLERASVHVISLRGRGQMGLELLEYLQPGDGRAAPEDTTPDDLWWSRTIIRQNEAAASPVQILDPDNHGVLLI